MFTWLKRLHTYPLGYRIVLAVLVLAFVAQSAILLTQALTSPYDPLGDYPQQEVLNDAGPTGLPTVEPGEGVMVEATKCNTTDEPVQGFVSIRWVSQEPRGSSIPVVTDSPTTIYPGCSTDIFDNGVPERVRERDAELRGTSGIPVAWRIVGFEQPVSEDGELGVGVSWTTDTFVLG